MRDPQNPNEVDSNHYAFPLPISPVIDTVTKEVIRIDTLPTGADAKLKETPDPWKSKPASEYVPEYQNLRKDLKPLLVVQPEGASFTVTSAGETGNVISWQKWTFRLGYNQREGPVLYDVSKLKRKYTLVSLPYVNQSLMMIIDPIRWAKPLLSPLIIRHEYPVC